ncbi:MAG: NAD(P)H-dependent oxidoreductase subunit E [Heliobacteriaceae bacterium]|jgi:NADH:ubiquinone oxidoreductase subunit E|nr:NAD(P)H-dependent oxidoreductase subunit E [Heliobacteriaceae bacterium]
MKMNNPPKIEVRICNGTSCCLMGASRLMKLFSIIRRRFGCKADVLTAACLGQCWRENNKPPHALVGDEIIYNATVEKVIENLESKL